MLGEFKKVEARQRFAALTESAMGFRIARDRRVRLCLTVIEFTGKRDIGGCRVAVPAAKVTAPCEYSRLLQV